MGVPRGLVLSSDVLDARYRELSLQVHPDRFAQSDARERRFSAEHTTLLNEAYRTLKDETRRAFYLLKLHGVDLNREDGGTQKDLPLEFLEEIIERREALADVRAAKNLEAAQKMAQDIRQQLRASLERANSQLTLLESGSSDAATVKREASHALAKVRYFQRFLEEVDAMEEELLG
jgi:molecular chaperone HscB